MSDESAEDAVEDQTEEASLREDPISAARHYAWQWFRYHAAQRQAVFRFFVLMAGAVATGYISVQDSLELRPLAWLFGLLLSTISFLFWRLDERSRILIQLAEDYLIQDE